jgi:glycosyltransferase involved in cell wall biosynthesis
VRLAEMSREAALARGAALWLTVGESLAREIANRIGIEPPSVIRNCCAGLMARRPSRLREDLGLSQGCRLVISLNSFRPNDGLEIVVDALALLPENIHLAILGTPARGAGAEMLLDRAASAGVRDRLHFPPLQPPSRLVEYLAGADMGVVALRPITSNLRVALPNRIFELFAAGLPVATSRIEDIAALTTRFDAGRVYDEDDPRAAAAAIADILDHLPQYRTSTANAALDLTWERESLQYLRALEKLAEAGPLGA